MITDQRDHGPLVQMISSPEYIQVLFFTKYLAHINHTHISYVMCILTLNFQYKWDRNRGVRKIRDSKRESRDGREGKKGTAAIVWEKGHCKEVLTRGSDLLALRLLSEVQEREPRLTIVTPHSKTMITRK